MDSKRSPAYFYPADEAWSQLARRVCSLGHVAQARGTVFREVIGAQQTVDMLRPIISLKERKLGYKFMAAEAAWILGGDARVSTIERYAQKIKDFSDDGQFFAGAYGPMIMAQMPYLIKVLRKDPGTRQAVIGIWKPSPGESKDIPCTLTVQFLLRGDDLHCIYTMRSSDLWLGVPYDWFSFSMLTAYVILCLRQTGDTPWCQVKPGALLYTAGSCHIYEHNEPDVLRVLQNEDSWGVAKSFNIDEFPDPESLIRHMWSLANGQGHFTSKFALETWQWKE